MEHDDGADGLRVRVKELLTLPTAYSEWMKNPHFLERLQESWCELGRQLAIEKDQSRSDARRARQYPWAHREARHDADEAVLRDLAAGNEGDPSVADLAKKLAEERAESEWL